MIIMQLLTFKASVTVLIERVPCCWEPAGAAFTIAGWLAISSTKSNGWMLAFAFSIAWNCTDCVGWSRSTRLFLLLLLFCDAPHLNQLLICCCKRGWSWARSKVNFQLPCFLVAYTRCKDSPWENAWNVLWVFPPSVCIVPVFWYVEGV